MLLSTKSLTVTLLFLRPSQVLAAPPRGDSSAQEAQTQKYCAVPGLCQSGWFHQDLHGGSTRRYES